MRLNDLINDGQTQACSPFELRLERLEDFFYLLRRNSGASVTNSDAPFIRLGAHRSCNGALACNCADGIFQEVPKHLLDLVTVHCGPSLGHRKIFDNLESGTLGTVL